MYKNCSVCKEEKLLSGFRKDKTQKSGYQPRCKVCVRSAINSSYARYKNKVIANNHARQRETRALLLEYKQAHGCNLCLERSVVCLDFHHLDPSQKDFQLSSVSTQCWERVLEEVNKCILVCKNCHAKIHAGIIEV